MFVPLASTFNDLRDVRPRPAEKTAAEWAAYLRTRIPDMNLSVDQAAPAEGAVELQSGWLYWLTCPCRIIPVWSEK